ncbi:hypothetical protein [Halalkalibacter okhensis]|uniref:hypothetical protein n=1 Tax=Halalkalibacter okhensis TaxID=333138 RepID=UPI000A8716BB|nr:hypothetical protein [Halalkalibacter okhensis]
MAIIGFILGVIGLKEVNLKRQPGRVIALIGIGCNTFAIVFPILSTVYYLLNTPTY